MAKTKISEFSSTPGNNTDIDSINIAEGCAPSGINDAIRELMAQLKDFQTGAVGDSFNGPVGTTTAAAGAFTTLTTSSTVTHNGGTANGVAYLDGSKVLTSGSALTFDGSNFAVNGNNISAVNSLGFRNRIINGDMRIDQRNNGASVSSGFSVDRFGLAFSAGSKFTAQQNAGAVTPPSGFTYYLGATSSSAYALATSDYFNLYQNIEGYNAADLGWGAVGAQSVTLSFWVRSSLTGTFGGSLRNGSANYSYPFSFTISAANTWEQKSITITGPTAGTWSNTNGTGIGVNFGLGVGATYSGTAGSWAGANYLSATGAVSVVGTSGATFYITGVQLEAGSVATPFERRPFGTELALCQRYFQKSYDYSVVPGTNTPTNYHGQNQGSVGAANSTSLKSVSTSLVVSMRTPPTVTLYDRVGNINKASNDNIGSYTDNQNVTVNITGPNNFCSFINNGVSCATLAFFYTASAEL